MAGQDYLVGVGYNGYLSIGGLALARGCIEWLKFDRYNSDSGKPRFISLPWKNIRNRSRVYVQVTNGCPQPSIFGPFRVKKILTLKPLATPR
jgi:hypothetical protein